MGRPVKFNRAQIARMTAEGFTPEEIAKELGAKSPTHIRVLVRKLRQKDPESVKRIGRPIARFKLDVGKVKALAGAGWTIGQIYYEMGMVYPIEEIREAMKC